MIGNYIKYMRESSGLSQVVLGKKLNIAQTTLSGYETGYSKPNYDVVQQIAEICDFEIMLKDKNSGEILTVDKKQDNNCLDIGKA